jgi:hypothetical protein
MNYTKNNTKTLEKEKREYSIENNEEANQLSITAIPNLQPNFDSVRGSYSKPFQSDKYLAVDDTQRLKLSKTPKALHTKESLSTEKHKKSNYKKELKNKARRSIEVTKDYCSPKK